MQDYADMFAADGILAGFVPNFAPRSEQQCMAEAVGQALHERSRLVIEAGTGIGKTFAYLVPTLLSGLRVIISTGTRNLQDQLYDRDLPAVSAALGRPASVALLKGRTNYLCLHRLALAAGEARFASGPHGGKLARIRAWSARTRSGDIGEVPDIPEDDPLWSHVTSTNENCLGPKCADYAHCHVVRARRSAMDHQVVIVNHHLLLADLALKEEGFGELLPGAEAVILDEAHQLPEIAAQFFGTSLSSRQLLGLAEDTLAEYFSAGADTPALKSCADRLHKAVRDARLAFGNGVRRASWQELGGAALAELAALVEFLGELQTALEPLADRSVGLDSCHRRALEARAGLDALLADEVEGVRWADVSARGFRLYLTPFDTAETLGGFVNDGDCAWVFTSATLAVGDEFGHFTRRIGIREAHTVKLDSPFDYANHALLYLPEDLPEPATPGFTRAVVDRARPVLQASGGRAFLLFTSHRALREAAAYFEELEDLGFPVLVQGTAPRDVLLKRFRALGNAVLLGTGSFWEGVDVRGAALGLVVIDKLPFASPGDPVLQARLDAIRREGGNPFLQYQLPQAVIALKQGVGRLIRDVHDTGVVVICDTRLRSKSYGRVFLDSLPPMPRTRSLRDVLAFLRGSAAATAAAEPAQE